MSKTEEEEYSEKVAPARPAIDIDGRLSRLSVVDRPKVRELLEDVLEESDSYSGSQDSDTCEEIRARNQPPRGILDFLLA